MATYLVLAKFTDQGIRNIRETTNRADAVREMAPRFGVNVKDVYWTLGAHDVALILEAQDEAAIAAFGMTIGSAGNVTTQTMRALNREEMKGVLARMAKSNVAVPA